MDRGSIIDMILKDVKDKLMKDVMKNDLKDLKDIASKVKRKVEIDAEANLELVRKLDIRSTPTTLFLDSMGHEVGRAMGAPKRDQVLKAISAIA